MTTIVIKSNHGNHEGFNRKWEILNGGYAFDTTEEALRYLANIADEEEPEFNPDNGDIAPRVSLPAYSNDLCYYYVVTEEEYFAGWFNGGHRGYANDAIKAIFDDNE